MTDLTVEVRGRDRIVGVAGVDARPGIVSEFLGIDPIEVRIGGILGAVSVGTSVAIGALSRLLK